MKSIAAVASLAVIAACSLRAQSGETSGFDVASVRAADPGKEVDRHQHRIHTTPGNVVMRSAGLDEMVMWAYHVEFYQFAGPAWMQSARFDIVAKAPGPASDDEMRAMMQRLLASRFGLVVHHEKKELAALALVATKDGPKLKPSDSQGESEFRGEGNGRPVLHLNRMSMHEFATLLSEPMRKPVVDLTGIPGTFDILLDATNYAPPPPAPGEHREREDEGYMVVRAIQDQLGLRLEPRKLSMDTLVVDHAEKNPTEN